MDLNKGKDYSTVGDVIEIVNYPSDYILVHALHLALDKGYKIRTYNVDDGRLLVHGNSWNIYGFQGWLDVRVGDRPEGRTLWITVQTDYFGQNVIHKDVAEQFWKDLDFRLMNEYTAHIERDGSGERMMVHEMWYPVLVRPFPGRLEEPTFARAIRLLGFAECLNLALITFLCVVMDISDYFVHWYGLFIFAIPPVLAIGLLLDGRTSIARTAFDWGQAGGVFVLAILTMGLGYFLLFIPSVLASFAIDEVERWRNLYEDQEGIDSTDAQWAKPLEN